MGDKDTSNFFKAGASAQVQSFLSGAKSTSPGI